MVFSVKCILVAFTVANGWLAYLTWRNWNKVDSMLKELGVRQ